MSGPAVLLVEPQFVLRRAIGAVAGDLGLAVIKEATSVDGAIAMLGQSAYELIVLDASVEEPARRLLTLLRRGQLACPASTPVIALTTGDPDALAARLADLDLQCAMRKPLKIGVLLDAVRRVWAESAALSLAD